MSTSDEIRQAAKLIWDSAYIQENPKKSYGQYYPDEFRELTEFQSGDPDPGDLFSSKVGQGFYELERLARKLENPSPQPTVKPGVPTGLAATIVNGNQVKLTWSANPASDAVDVYQAYMDDSINLDLAINGLEFTTPPLTGTHIFRVSAHNAVDYGDWTNSVSVTIPGTTPPPPTGGANGISYFKDGNGELPSSHIPDYGFVFTSWGGAPVAGASVAKKVLVYMSAVSCKPWAGGWHYGITAEELRAGGWQMKDAAGNELMNTGYGNVPLGDPGLPGYQQKWINNVLALIDQWGIDGVFIDDFARNYKTVDKSSRFCEKYPGSANAPMPEYEVALVSFAKAVHDAFKARGKYVCWNAQPYIPGYTPSDTGGSALEFWPKIVAHADGLMDEFWNTVGQTNPRNLSEGWLPNLRVPALCEQAGVDFHFHWSGSEAIGNYLFCSMLLENVGAMAWWNGSTNQWLPIYSKLPLGNPLGLKTQSGEWYERKFQNRTVRVNPTTEYGEIV